MERHLLLTTGKITVTGVKEAQYIRVDDCYHSAKQDMKIVIIHIKVKNVGIETGYLSDIWGFVLAATVGKATRLFIPPI